MREQEPDRPRRQMWIAFYEIADMLVQAELEAALEPEFTTAMIALSEIEEGWTW